MTRSHARSITIKPAHSYGGSNFLVNCPTKNYAFKTYEYLWGSKTVTFEACAQNWAVDKSYNALGIYSDRGQEVYEEYDAVKSDIHKVSCLIGSVTGDSFLIQAAAGTYLSADNFVWTCSLFHEIYKKEQDLTHGYYLIPIYFAVPYTRELGSEFSAYIKVKAAYGGSGSGTEQRYDFQLVEMTNGQNLIDAAVDWLSPGDECLKSLKGTFDEDMKEYCLSAWYYDSSTDQYRRMCGLCWRIKAVSGTGTFTWVYVECVKP